MFNKYKKVYAELHTHEEDKATKNVLIQKMVKSGELELIWYEQKFGDVYDKWGEWMDTELVFNRYIVRGNYISLKKLTSSGVWVNLLPTSKESVKLLEAE